MLCDTLLFGTVPWRCEMQSLTHLHRSASWLGRLSEDCESVLGAILFWLHTVEFPCWVSDDDVIDCPSSWFRDSMQDTVRPIEAWNALDSPVSSHHLCLCNSIFSPVHSALIRQDLITGRAEQSHALPVLRAPLLQQSSRDHIPLLSLMKVCHPGWWGKRGWLIPLCGSWILKFETYIQHLFKKVT